MSSAEPLVWRSTGLVWTADTALLEWSAPGGGSRRSPLGIGAELALAVGSDRRCTGVWRAGRRIACPTAEPLPAGTRTAQCGSCARLARSNSVATDTRLDDPRPFAVYLAHHGDAGIKVGITAAERGTVRLLEQGALASTVLSTGTLPSARRTEHLLGTALGLPDRVLAARKRTARLHPAAPAARAQDLLETVTRTSQLPWPEAQTRRPATVTDHTPLYGLPPDGLHPHAAVRPLTPGTVLTGRVLCRIAADLYLSTPNGTVLLDTRLLSGWALERARPDTEFSAPLQPLERPDNHDVLF